jgi:hypothetical protein
LLVEKQNITVTSEGKLGSLLWNQNILSCDLEITFLDIYPTKLQSYIHTKSAHRCLQ